MRDVRAHGAKANGLRRGTATAGFVLSIAVAVNIAAHLHRSAPSVVAPDILRDLALNPAFLAAVTSAYFLAATLTQVPIGILFDRFGLARTIPVLLIVAAGGVVMFAAASSGFGLILGRILSGIGCGTVIMGSVVLCAQIATPERFPTLVGGVLGIGQLGNVVSTAPIAFLSSLMGWRGSFLLLALATLVLAGLYQLAARHGSGVPPARESIAQALIATGRILMDRRLWPVFAMAFVGYSTIFCLLGLWGAVYLDAVFGVDLISRGNMLLIMAVGYAASFYFFGWLQRWLGSAKRAVQLGAVLTLSGFLALAIVPRPGLLTVGALFGAIGLAGGFCGTIITHGRLFYPPGQIGRGVTTMNTVVLGGATIAQAWSGVVVAAAESAIPDDPAFAFRVLFAALAVWLALGLWFYRRAEAHPREPGTQAKVDIAGRE